MPILDVPARFAGAEINHIANPELASCVRDYASNLRNNLKKGIGLLLSGPPGIGKTWAIVALTNYLVKRSVTPPWVVFDTSYRLLDRYAPVVRTQDTFDHGRGCTWDHSYESCQWLVINDLGKTYQGGKLREQDVYKVGRLLRTRSEKMLVTHITTNLPLRIYDGYESMRDRYGDSVWSLVRESMECWELDGPDMRGRT